MSAFGPVAIETMRQAISNAWDSLSSEQQEYIKRSDMALRVLAAAADGERDLFTLTEAALKPIPLNEAVHSRVGAENGQL